MKQWEAVLLQFPTPNIYITRFITSKIAQKLQIHQETLHDKVIDTEPENEKTLKKHPLNKMVLPLILVSFPCSHFSICDLLVFLN